MMSSVEIGRNMRKKQRKNIRKSVLIGVLILLLFTAACTVFSVLCLHGSTFPFLKKNALLFSAIASLLFVVCFGVSAWFLHANKQTLYKTAISVFIFVLFCLVLIYIFQKTGFFAIVKDEKTLQAYLEGKGAWMPVVYVVLQYLQVVILPIPSVVSTLAGVALFGPFYTVLYSLIGILLGSATAFFIGRKLGYKAAAWMVGEDTLNQWQRKLKGKDNLVLTLMFLLPVFPDDVLCFIAGLSSMTTKYFFIMIVISRILAVSTTCYSMELIPLNEWWGLLIWGIIILAVLIAFILIYKYLDRIQDFISTRFKKDKRKNK